MRFVAGLLVGLVVGVGGYLSFQLYGLHNDPCLEHCGTGTVCVEGVCLVEEPQAKVRPKGRRRRGRRHGRRRRRQVEGSIEEPTLKKPSAADLKPVTKGQSLQGADYIDMSKGGAEGRELDEADVNTRFRKLDGRIVACIDRARQGWDVSRGRVLVAFRIERSGQVKRVKVSAPALLLREGLYDCVHPLVASLRFPASSRSLMMSYPFSLE